MTPPKKDTNNDIIDDIKRSRNSAFHPRVMSEERPGTLHFS